MRLHKRADGMRITIDPGEYYASRESVIISTLLGSCVAACLYDPINKVVGMNHFLLANRRYAKNMPVIESEAGRYGIHAMELLINEMMKQGASRANLKAKVFGGGDVLGKHHNSKDKFFFVGQVNSRFVQEFLRKEKIPVTASDLGGEHGRVVHFCSSDFAAHMKQITHNHDAKVVSAERKYWRKSIQEHEMEQEKVDVEIW